jgi:hypothetical protein
MHPHMETLLHFYAYGKPKETVEHTGPPQRVVIRIQKPLWLPKRPEALRRLRLLALSARLDYVASVVVSLLHSLQFMIRSRASLPLEIIALRHQLAVVHRSRRTRLRFTSADRLLWAWAFSGMARLALGRTHRQAGDGRRVAPARFSPVLGVEEPSAHRAP